MDGDPWMVTHCSSSHMKVSQNRANTSRPIQKIWNNPPLLSFTTALCHIFYNPNKTGATLLLQLGKLMQLPGAQPQQPGGALPTAVEAMPQQRGAGPRGRSQGKARSG